MNQPTNIMEGSKKCSLSKESMRSDYVPKLKLARITHFTVEVKITSP
jgi:hypothetical protein